MKSVNPNAKITEPVPGDEKLPPEDQTVAEYTQLTQEEQEFMGNIDLTGTRITMALHLGLAGLKNFNGPDGKPVTLTRDKDKRPIVGDKLPWLSEQLVLIPRNVQDRMAVRILRGVGLTEAEAKNS